MVFGLSTFLTRKDRCQRLAAVGGFTTTWQLIKKFYPTKCFDFSSLATYMSLQDGS